MANFYSVASIIATMHRNQGQVIHYSKTRATASTLARPPFRGGLGWGYTGENLKSTSRYFTLQY